MGLTNVAGTAKTAGVDFGDLHPDNGTDCTRFSSAADAGTSLKTMIANLQPTTTAAKATFNELGLMAFNAWEKPRWPLVLIFPRVVIRSEEIDAAMRQYIVNTLGIQQGTDKFEGIRRDVCKFQYQQVLRC